MEWVREGVLGRSAGPGYSPFGGPIQRADVDYWMEEVEGLGAAAIICLLAEDELRRYDDVLRAEGGLLRFYEARELQVFSIPVEDLKEPDLDPDELRAVEEAFNKATKPVLIHCSAGLDRTGAAVEHLVNAGLV